MSKIRKASLVSVRKVVETIERRLLLCLDHEIPIAENPKYWPQTIIDTPEELAAFQKTEKRIDVKSGPESTGPEAAPIVWVNRGVTSGTSNDRFNDVFGANANTARAVMDAAINMWSRVIGSFNYTGSFAGSTYQLTVSMASSGTSNGASAGVSTWGAGKPLAGAITMGRGSDGAGGSWYIDPTPYDNSEFMGTIDNAFAGQAQSGSPAAGRGDFLTVALAEIAHCMGLYSAPSLFQSGGLTNTGINDAVGGSTGSKLFTFSNVNVQHLMTEFDSGAGKWGSAIHTADPQTVNVSGNSWAGTDDAGNAYYSFSQRVMVPENLRLVFNDSLGYSTVPAATFGTFYATMDGSTLRVRGSEDTDVIYVSTSGSNIVVSVDPTVDVPGSGNLRGAGNLAAWTSTFAASTVGSIQIDGNGGQDFIRIEGNGGKFVTVNAGAGDDFIDFSFNARNLGNIIGGAALNGGTGADSVFVYDDSNASASTYTITSGRFDRAGWGGFSYAADIEGLTLRTGTAADVVNISSTFTGQPIYLNSNGGNDTVNIGNATNGLQSIAADVQIQNTPSFTTLNVNNGPDTANRTWDIDNTGDGVFGFVRGLAPANIFWKNADISSNVGSGVNVTYGSGVNNYRVSRINKPVSINKAASNVTDDTAIVGLAAAGGVQGILARLTIDNNPSYTNLTIDDTGDFTARTATLDLTSTTRNLLTGLAPAPIDFDGTDTHNITIRTGSGADTLSVLRAKSSGGIGPNAFLITSAGGQDIVNVGNATTGLGEINTYKLEVTNPPSFTTLSLDNAADATVRSASMSYDSGTDRQSIVGVNNLGTTFLWRPGDIESSGGVTYKDGAAASTFAIADNRRLFNFVGRGADAVKFGAAGSPPKLGADVYLTNPPNFNNITVDASTDTQAHTFGFDTTVIGGFAYASISGVDPTTNARIFYKQGDAGNPTVLGGTGDDTFNFNSTAVRTLNVNGGDGNDVFNLGSPVVTARTVAPLFGPVNIDGGATGVDLIAINDQDGAVVNRTFTLGSGSAAFASATHSFANIAEVDLNPSAFGSTATVNGTGTNYSVFVNSNAGADNVKIAQTAPGSAVYVNAASDGSTGYDSIDADYLNAGTPAWAIIPGGYNGSISARSAGLVSIQSTAAIRTQSLSYTGGGEIDIGFGSIVYDYSGTSPLSDVASAIASGYAAGAWNGPGIQSSTAASTSGRAIGFGEASDLLAPLPGTWRGASISGDAVLIGFTLSGDANLDGTVNFDDLLRLAASYNQSGRVWSQGDFTYDGATNFDDLLQLASNYNQTLPGSLGSLFSSTPVPPPSASPRVNPDEDAGPDVLA
jgi:hypothetical protein